MVSRKGIVLYPVAGRIWSIPARAVPADALKTGSRLERDCGDLINRSVANEICGSAEPLTASQLVFLCQVTTTKSSEVAAHLDVNRSNVSVWSNNGRPIPRHESTAMKKWFWHKLFGKDLGEAFGPVPTEALFDDRILLKFLRHEAIERGAAFAVSEAKAKRHKGASEQPLESSCSSNLH